MEQEFTCAGCGRLIISFGGPPNQTKCATCIHSPGWFNDPQLRGVFEPDWKEHDESHTES